MVILPEFVLQIFVGNLDPNVAEEELKQTFLQFGEIVSVKIHAGKGFGFVQFGTRFIVFFLPFKHLNCIYGCFGILGWLATKLKLQCNFDMA